MKVILSRWTISQFGLRLMTVIFLLHSTNNLFKYKNNRNISNTSIGVKTILPRVDPAFLPVLNYDKTSFDCLVWKGNVTGNHKLPER